LQNNFGEWVAKTFCKPDRCMYVVDIYTHPSLLVGKKKVLGTYV